MTKSVNSEVSTFEETKNTVLTEVRNGVRGVFAIGKSLKASAQVEQFANAEGNTPYIEMFNELPFDTKVGSKFIKIFETTWLRKLGMNNSTMFNLPFGYNTLYELATSKWSEDEDKVEVLIEGFTVCKFIVNDKEVASNKVSLAKLKDLYAEIVEAQENPDANLPDEFTRAAGSSSNLTGDDDTDGQSSSDGDSESEQPVTKTMVTVAKIEIDKDIFEKDLIQLKVLRKTLATLGIAVSNTQITVDDKKLDGLTKKASKVFAELQSAKMDDEDLDYLTNQITDAA